MTATCASDRDTKGRLALSLEALLERRPPDGMTAARALVATHEDIGRRVEEQNPYPLCGRAQRLERGTDLVVVVTATNHERGAVMRVARIGHQFGELGDQ